MRSSEAAQIAAMLSVAVLNRFGGTFAGKGGTVIVTPSALRDVLIEEAQKQGLFSLPDFVVERDADDVSKLHISWCT